MKKIFWESAITSLMLMTFVVPSVLAWDYGPYYAMDPTGGGDYNEYVLAGIGANVDGGQIEEAYWYAGRVLGSAQGFNGYLWFRLYYDATNYIEWYDAGTQYQNSGSVSTTTVRTRAWSGFYDSDLNEWSWDSMVTITM